MGEAGREGAVGSPSAAMDSPWELELELELLGKKVREAKRRGPKLK